MIIKKYSEIEVKCNEEDLNKKGVIYCLTFPNNKTYIGQTKNKLHRRISTHCSINNCCTKLRHAIKKYKTFTVSILSSNLDINQMNLFEQMFIKMLNSNGTDGYNLDSGGMNKTLSDETKNRISNSERGKKITDETKRKMSNSHKGKTFTELHKDKIRKKSIGKTHSDDVKKRISETQIGNTNMLGKTHTDDVKKRLSEINTGKKHSDETKLKMSQKVKSIPDNIIFNSVKDCELYYEITNLSQYYKGRINKKTAQTFILIMG